MNKVALVTGCHGGIGRAFVRQLKAQDYFVIGADKVAGDAPVHVTLKPDLAELATDESKGNAFAEELRTALGGRSLSLLINNAAVQILGSMADTKLCEFRTSMDVNLVAPFRLTQLCLEHLARGACVLNIGSVHAQATKPGFVSYATSKAALQGLTQAMAIDLGTRCRVLCLAPAAVRTEMLMAGFEGQPDKFAQLASMHPLGRVAEPDEVARFGIMLANEATFSTGSTFHFDGGVLSRLHDPN